MYSSSGEIEIGATLRKARQELGVTLDDVEDETKIRKRYLNALEREDYADLPSEVYARGFLKTYASYLGLDGEALSLDLKNRWEAVQERRHQQPAPKREAGRQTPRPGASRSYNPSIGGAPNRRRISIVAIIGFAILLALLGAAVFGLYSVGQSSRSVQESPNQQADQSPERGGQPNKPVGTTSEEPTNAASDPEQADQQGANIPPPNEAKETEEAEAGETRPTENAAPAAPPQEKITMNVAVAQVPVWLNVQVDGTTVYEQVTQPGFSQTFEAGQSISVWTGNAWAVRLEINGQNYGALGAPGEVKSRTFVLKQPAEG